MAQHPPTSRRTMLGFAAAVVASVPLGAAAFAADPHARAAAMSRAKGVVRTAKTFQTAAELRDLWVDHIFWVRAVSVAAVNNRDEVVAVAEQQAVSNAKSIAASIEPFYGPAAKDAFFKLLGGHYGAVKAYLVATVAGDGAAQSKATQALTSNAGQIANFLSKANPYLPKDAVQALLLAHGGHHIRQIQELKEGRFEAEARTWEEMKHHVYQIADATADALARQFAKKFV